MPGHSLEVTESSKYLGITTSRGPYLGQTYTPSSWEGEQDYRIGFLRRNFRDYTITVKRVTYVTIVIPAMEYAPTVWDPVCQMHIQLLATTMTLRQLRRWWGLPEDRIHADYWQEIAIFQICQSLDRVIFGTWALISINFVEVH